LRNDLAFHYYTDASDFLDRFNLLYEHYSKTKRFKCFVDLLMGFECILKSHIFLSHPTDDMKEVYKAVRKCSHNLDKLASLANYLGATDYQVIKGNLGEYSVLIRYSLDAYENFLPSCAGFGEGKYNYSSTLTNHPWMMSQRDLLQKLINLTSGEFGGFVDLDFDKIVDESRQMREFAKDVGVVNS